MILARHSGESITGRVSAGMGGILGGKLGDSWVALD